jgi:hypothetical protein
MKTIFLLTILFLTSCSINPIYINPTQASYVKEQCQCKLELPAGNTYKDEKNVFCRENCMKIDIEELKERCTDYCSTATSGKEDCLGECASSNVDSLRLRCSDRCLEEDFFFQAGEILCPPSGVILDFHSGSEQVDAGEVLVCRDSGLGLFMWNKVLCSGDNCDMKCRDPSSDSWKPVIDDIGGDCCCNQTNGGYQQCYYKANEEIDCILDFSMVSCDNPMVPKYKRYDDCMQQKIAEAAIAQRSEIDDEPMNSE